MTNGDTPADFKNARRKKVELLDPAKDRLPPWAPEAEQALMGTLIEYPDRLLPVCIERFKSSEPFYDLRHRILYEHLCEMYDARTPIDMPSLYGRLRDGSKLESVGGIAYVSSLADAGSIAGFEHYLDVVWKKHKRRLVIDTCTKIVAQCYDCLEDEQLFDEIERDLTHLTNDGVAHGEILDAKTLVHQTINLIEEHHQRQNPIYGLATGFADFDKMTCGLQNGEMIVIAARPSLGKTALAMQIAEHVSVVLKHPVGVFSLEMKAKSLMLRAVCSLARVNLRNVAAGFLADRDFPKITSAAGKLTQAALHIDDTPALSIAQLRAKARRMHSRFGIKLLIVDYLQLMRGTSRENRQQDVADISTGIKTLAHELDVPIIAISQFNREIEKGAGRKPRMSDMRDSGQIEQDADLVAMLYRATEGNDDDNQAEALPVNLLIGKQRNGPTGIVNLIFLRPYTRFEAASKISLEN